MKRLIKSLGISLAFLTISISSFNAVANAVDDCYMGKKSQCDSKYGKPWRDCVDAIAAKCRADNPNILSDNLGKTIPKSKPRKMRMGNSLKKLPKGSINKHNPTSLKTKTSQKIITFVPLGQRNMPAFLKAAIKEGNVVGYETQNCGSDKAPKTCCSYSGNDSTCELFLALCEAHGGTGYGGAGGAVCDGI